ncbi:MULTISPECIES: hypothetical protein [Thermomonospora]|uniref:WXG100 family type VII secretion target n=1 Tax=Thermomonospora cellulosilytica TaxID=1411118 RepID=A0A7W3R7Z9_9ACTN|nr:MULTISPECIES: hypothetical protein [Thermomonospora]MBA9003181.1 hypothetical protein [Thermomonospora cellulosilytica]
MGVHNLPEAQSREIEISRDRLRKLADELQKDLDDLKRQRLAEGIQDDSPNIDHIGHYQAGQGLSNTVNTARTHVGSTITQFLTAYQNVINALYDSARNYDRAEDRTRESLQNVNGGGNGPSMV